MAKIYLDSWRMDHSGWPHYSSLGNKILHLYFCIKYANKHGLELRIPHESNLDKVFDTSKIIEDSGNKTNIFLETTAHETTSLEKIFTDSKNQFLEEAFFLDQTLDPNKDVSVKGHFYHYELMPDIETLKAYLKHNERNYSIAKEIMGTHEKTNKNCIYVHYRGTDFKNHENRMGDCRLASSFYSKSFDLCNEKFDNPLFLCFSDEPDFYTEFNKSKYNIKALRNDYEIDWLLLHLSNKMISSNSSFCWTASLHNKDFLIQPRNGLNAQQEGNLQIPYGFHIPGAILI